MKFKAYKLFKKCRNAERFYACCYSTIVLNAVKGLTRNGATLLSRKVTNCLLVHSKEKIENHTSTCSLLTKLSSEEKAGLQYIGGYVLHKLHNKHVNTNKSSESKQAISILKAGKARDQDATQCQWLTSSLNRGGLWPLQRMLNQFLRGLNTISGVSLQIIISKTLMLPVLYQDLFMTLKLYQHTTLCCWILN